jgi:hypothetical protein
MKSAAGGREEKRGKLKWEAGRWEEGRMGGWEDGR